MNIPKNGRVVVVDDQFDEAIPLIQVLSKRGISVAYYNGEFELLPEEPLEGIRFIFLDMEIGTAGQDEKSKTAKVISILRKIVGRNYNPYVIIAWTKHIELIEKVREGLGDTAPLLILNMQKSECKDDEGNFDLEIITGNLKEEMNKLGSLNVFITWESMVHNSATKTFDEAFSLIPFDANWDKRMQSILHNFAKSFAGKQLTRDFAEILPSALMTFNGMLSENLDRNIRGNLDLFNQINTLEFSSSEALSEDIISKINSLLLLTSPTDGKVTPGNLYLVDTSYINISDSFRGSVDIKQHILLEVSPSCDYAQDKWQRARVLPGVLCSTVDVKKLNKTDAHIVTPLILVNNIPYHLVFDARLFNSLEFTELEKIPVNNRLKHNLLVDIQSKISQHVVRPGTFAIVK
jgi:hypothetical protein